VTAGAPQPNSEQDRTINVLVGLALDDIDSGNLDVEAALRLVARRTWTAGYSEGRNASDGGVTEPLGDEPTHMSSSESTPGTS
jgi:hypothetical protein